VVDQLANEYGRAGKNVLFVEQHVDRSVGNRIDRWWDAYTGFPELGVPLVMVESGYRFTCGSEDYREKYTQMVDAALMRPAEAEIFAGYYRDGNNLQITAEVTNWSGRTLNLDNYATVNVLVYERARVVHTNRFVRAATAQAVIYDLPHGETQSFYLEVRNVPVAEWRLARVVVMVDYRPDTASTTYDMLQAVEAVVGAPPTRTPPATPTIPRTSTPTLTSSPGPTITPGPSPTSIPGVPIYLPFSAQLR
jgi:hypothetical protein